MRESAHRPFPMPAGRWLMFQSWRDLLFGSWRVSHSVLRLLVPARLRIDAFDSAPWVTLAPFVITGLRFRLMPPLPGLSTFGELNLRTYVTYDGVPGVFFFTLDASSRIAVAAARRFYKLPYRQAHIDVKRRDGWVEYHSRRSKGFAELKARYRPTGEPFEAAPETLDHFLAERYALYTVDENGSVWRGDIHHARWPLQRAEAEVEINTVSGAHGIPRPRERPVVHYAARQDTLIWPLKRVG